MKECWESIYQQGKQLNKYPFSEVVSLIISKLREKPNLRVLELGCGAGNNIVFMAENGVDVSGIDISPTAVAFSKERLAKKGLYGDVVCGCFSKLPWPTSYFDLVVDRGALTCVSENKLRVALNEVNRVLAPDGEVRSWLYSRKHPAYSDATVRDNGYASCFNSFFPEIDGLFFADESDVESLFGSIGNLTYSHDLSYSMGNEKEVSHAMWSICVKKQ